MRDDPLAYIHQAVVHQLQHSSEEIEDGDGLVVDFDYDEDVDQYISEMGAGITGQVSTERTVTLELTYVLPE